MPSGWRGMASTASASVGPPLTTSVAKVREMPYATSSQVTGLPSCQRTPSRRVNDQVLRSLLGVPVVGGEVADEAGLLVGVGVRRVGGQRAGEDPAGEGDVVARGDPLGVPGDDRAEREGVQRAAVGVDAVTDGRGGRGLLGVGRRVAAERERPRRRPAPPRARHPRGSARGPADGDVGASDGSRESAPGACLRCPSGPPGLSSSSPGRRRGRAGSGRARPCGCGCPRGSPRRTRPRGRTPATARATACAAARAARGRRHRRSARW